MKSSIGVGLVVVCFLSALVASRHRTNVVARQLVDDLGQKRYAAADAYFAPSARFSLAKWSAAAKEMKAEAAFEEQSWAIGFAVVARGNCTSVVRSSDLPWATR